MVQNFKFQIMIIFWSVNFSCLTFRHSDDLYLMLHFLKIYMINAASSTLISVLIEYYRNKTVHSALFLTHDYLEVRTSIVQRVIQLELKDIT